MRITATEIEKVLMEANIAHMAEIAARNNGNWEAWKKARSRREQAEARLEELRRQAQEEEQ